MAGGLYDPPPPSPRPEDLIQVELRVATTTPAEIAKLRQFLPELQGRPLSDVLTDFAGKDFVVLVKGRRYETYHMVERARAAGLAVEEVIMKEATHDASRSVLAPEIGHRQAQRIQTALRAGERPEF